MTHTGRRIHIATLYFVLLLTGIGAGRLLDVELTATFAQMDTCAARTMMVNRCADLDTSHVTDRRGEPAPTTVAFTIHTSRDEKVADCLIARHWTGVPDDGSDDTVYAPTSEITHCQTKTAR